MPALALTVLTLTVLLLALAPRSAVAQDWIVLEGILDVEGWSTDDASRLLTRNDGRPLGSSTLTMWTALRLHAKLQLMALGEVEGEVGAGAFRDAEVEIDQLALRFSASPTLLVEAGKILPPVGIYAGRRLPITNPVIGAPDSYHVNYPWGVVVTGRWGRLDYRTGMVSKPIVHERYLPPPTDRLRPAVGAGVTLATGFRVGGSFTRGSYLNRDMSSAIPDAAAWSSFNQRIIAFDTRFARGHSEVRAEFSLSSYDVPTIDDAVRGKAGYVEFKRTWTPRFFTAFRLEGNDYPLVKLRDTGKWIGKAVLFWNAEAGIGYRFSRDSVLKVSYRGDRWENPEKNGKAFAFQFSHQFDVMRWLDQRMMGSGRGLSSSSRV